MSKADDDVSAKLGLGAAGSKLEAKGSGLVADVRARFAARPYLYGTIAAVLVILVLWLVFFRAAPAPDYVSDTVTRGDLKVVVTATGTVEPETSIIVGSEISGRIERVLADYNDTVKKGQVLLEIDTTALKSALAKSDATLDESRATLLQYEATRIEAAAKWKRYKSLIQTNAISQLDLDASLADLKRAEANYVGGQARVKANEAQRAADETALSKAVIRSPIDGIVIERNIEPGQTVAATFETPTLFTLADDLRRMELQVNVDEADVGQVRDGQLATFTVDAYPNRLFQAKIKKLRFASTTTSNVVSYVAVLEIDNSDMTLRPGMTATAEIVTVERKDVLLVPNGATRFTPPGFVAPQVPVTDSGYISKPVWRLKDGKPEAVALQLGLANGQQTEVLKGDVAAGDVVITDVRAKDTKK
ncbi:MAG: efflux RND transporter periplasmic adaptor subunit [Pseudomonadota bacterium]